MKYCTKCGAELHDEAVICPKCGCSCEYVKSSGFETPANKTNGFAIAGFVCAFFIPLLGWIFGGIGISKANKLGGKGKGLSIASLAVATVMFFINFAIIMSAY